MQDIVVKDLYNRLVQLRNAFLQYQNDFNAIDNILRNNVFCDNSINILRNITFRYKLNDNTSKFICDIINDITIIKEKYDAIKEKKTSLQNKLSILEKELKNRGLPTSNFVISSRSNISSLNELTKYYELLLEDEIRLNKIMNALTVEKENDKKDEEIIESKLEEINNNDIKIKEEQVVQNSNCFINPGEDELMNILSKYNENVYTKIINNKNTNIVIELKCCNNENNTTYDKTTITYDNIGDANYEFLWEIIGLYARNNSTKDEEIVNGVYKNISDSGNVLEMINFSMNNIEIIKAYIKQNQLIKPNSNNVEIVVDEDIESNSNDNVSLDKEKKLNFAAVIGPNILLMVVLVGILVASVFIATSIFNFLKI